MSAEDTHLLFLIVPGAFVALAIGIWLRRKHPAACVHYALQSQSLPWWVFAGGALLWGVWAISATQVHQFVTATVVGSLSALNLMGLILRVNHPISRKQVRTPAEGDPAGSNSSVPVDSP